MVKQKGKVFLLGSEGIGRGDDNIGYQILVNLLESLEKREDGPSAFIFWNTAVRLVADDLAKTENAFPMGENHWKFVNYLRDYYLKFGIAPPVRMVVKQTGIDLKQIYKLFPGGPAKGARKVAGLPKPKGCV